MDRIEQADRTSNDEDTGNPRAVVVAAPSGAAVGIRSESALGVLLHALRDPEEAHEEYAKLMGVPGYAIEVKINNRGYTMRAN